MVTRLLILVLLIAVGHLQAELVPELGQISDSTHDIEAAAQPNMLPHQTNSLQQDLPIEPNQCGCSRPEVIVTIDDDEAVANPDASEGDNRTGEEVCAMCISRLHSKDESLVLPCGHRFHQEEIEEWLRIKNDCPICRGQVDWSAPMEVQPFSVPCIMGLIFGLLGFLGLLASIPPILIHFHVL
ncbi:hypothetical protein Pst134EA_024170 [Puccinia striiformis f. sp. tritici]|uniref:hypothetical protein n=1 Tax=Puccinia striiformis f. sp. tritici TaxID=168172 RepID=UPI0020082ECE|nr:hypothetical protein Pst134EA_024170 [Puccinia striiformis f. sp. tritici]KAH9453288.1 hypothetical protein Pst134EA_024170 [Puccinia striiformis f. sp. tritici]